MLQAQPVRAAQVQETFHGQEPVGSQPGQEAPLLSPEEDQDAVRGSAGPCRHAGLCKAGRCILHQVRIGNVLRKDAAHPFQDLRMDIAGALAEIRRHLALDQFTVDEMAFAVHFKDTPYMAGQGDLFTRRRRRHDGPEFLGITADREFLTFLENAVKFERIDDPFPCKPHDQAASLRPLDMFLLNQIPQEIPVIGLGNAVEIGQRKYALSQRSRRELARRSKGAHGLMVQEAEGQPVEPRRFDPVFFPVKLDQRNGLEEFPGNRGRQHGPDLRFILPDDEPHLGRHAPPARAPHALQERRDRPGCIDLERPFQPSDVDAELQGGCRHRRIQMLFVLHQFLGTFPIGRGKVAVMDQETVLLMPQLTVLAEGGGHTFTFLAGVDKDKALPAPRMFEYVPQPGICLDRCLVALHIEGGSALDIGPAVTGLGIPDIEMLH